MLLNVKWVLFQLDYWSMLKHLCKKCSTVIGYESIFDCNKWKRIWWIGLKITTFNGVTTDHFKYTVPHHELLQVVFACARSMTLSSWVGQIFHSIISHNIIITCTLQSGVLERNLGVKFWSTFLFDYSLWQHFVSRQCGKICLSMWPVW